MQDFERGMKGGLHRKIAAFFLQEEIKISRLEKRLCFADKEPLSFRFEILHLAVGTSGRMNAENRRPI